MIVLMHNPTQTRLVVPTQPEPVLFADESPVVPPPETVIVAHAPRPLLFTATGVPLMRRIGF